MATEKTAPIPIDPGTPNSKQCIETQKTVEAFQKNCKDIVLPAALSDAEVANSNLASSLQALCDDRRAWMKAENTRVYYNQLHYNIAAGLTQDVGAALVCVDEQIKASDDIVKSYTEAVGKMKDACTKLLEVCRLAKDWSIDVKKTCNTKNKEDLNNILKGKGITDKDIIKKAESFEETAGIAQNSGDQVIESAVKVTGIFSFVNVASLKPCVEELKKLADVFIADTEGNIKTNDEHIKKAQKLILDDSPKLSLWYFNRAKADAKQIAVSTITGYLANVPPKMGANFPSLEEICNKLNAKPKPQPD